MWSRLPFGDELRAGLGSPGSSRRLSSSPRSRVWRVQLPEAQVVVKQLVAGPDADERYAREVTALGLAGRAATPVVPALLATDPGERVLVLEHLDHRRPSSDWIVDYATALARLHATARPEDVEHFPVGEARTRPTSTPSSGWPRLLRFLSRLACPANSMTS